MKIVKMLNQLYTAFDTLTDPKKNPNVFKVSRILNVFNSINRVFIDVILLQVETVGDKYMAVSGLPNPCEQHARCIARLALDMMDLCKEVIVDNKPVVR